MAGLLVALHHFATRSASLLDSLFDDKMIIGEKLKCYLHFPRSEESESALP